MKHDSPRVAYRAYLVNDVLVVLVSLLVDVLLDVSSGSGYMIVNLFHKVRLKGFREKIVVV